MVYQWTTHLWLLVFLQNLHWVEESNNTDWMVWHVNSLHRFDFSLFFVVVVVEFSAIRITIDKLNICCKTGNNQSYSVSRHYWFKVILQEHFTDIDMFLFVILKCCLSNNLIFPYIDFSKLLNQSCQSSCAASSAVNVRANTERVCTFLFGVYTEWLDHD